MFKRDLMSKISLDIYKCLSSDDMTLRRERRGIGLKWKIDQLESWYFKIIKNKEENF